MPLGSSNEFSGVGENVVQARDVGNIIFQAGTDSPSVPHQLPPSISGFVNRNEELSALDEVQRHAMQNSGGPNIVLITGMAGVGKTSLALYWLNKMRDAYPGGQLYVNLRGFGSDQAIRPSEVIDQFLRSLGTPLQKIPDTDEGRAALYRSVMHNRRSLVFLDNARDANQIRPLLPPSGPALTLITSRSRMASLVAGEGAQRILLSTFDPEAAIGLLIGGNPGADESETQLALILAGSCGYLPLCLRIILDRMISRRFTSFRDSAGEVLQEIQGAQNIFEFFAPLDDDRSMEVRNILSWSYNDLSWELRQAFRRLGLHPGFEFSVDDATELVGLPRTKVAYALDRLAHLSVLEYADRNRYKFHDLMRNFATEREQEEDEMPERDQALQRLLERYLRQVDAADRILAPGRRHVLPDNGGQSVFDSYDAAVRWCELERSNLIAAVHRAEAVGQYELAWKLGMALVTFLYLRRYRADRLEVSEISIRSARQAGDAFGEAWSLMSAGGAYADLENYDEARSHQEAAIRIWRDLGDQEGEGKCLENLSEVYKLQGALAEAAQIGMEALALRRLLGKEREVAITLCNLGEIYADRGDYPSARECFEEALSMRTGADMQTVAGALKGLAIVDHETEELDSSRRNFDQAIELYRASADSYGEAVTKAALSRLLRETGLRSEARSALLEALEIMRTLDDPSVPNLLRNLESLEMINPGEIGEQY